MEVTQMVSVHLRKSLKVFSALEFTMTPLYQSVVGLQYELPLHQHAFPIAPQERAWFSNSLYSFFFSSYSTVFVLHLISL